MGPAQIAFVAVLLACILAFFAPAIQRSVKTTLHRRRWAILFLPPALTVIFSLAEWSAHAFSVRLTLAVLLYTVLPVVFVALRQYAIAIAALWLPVEFAFGAALVPLEARGFLHAVIYGVAILLGLILFLCYAGLPGMKFNLPRSARDLWLPLAAFAITAPVLIAVGMPIGFIPPPHLPVQPAGRMASAFGIIFAGTALPEEILFRALIQNLIVQRWGKGWRTLLAASVIFGAAHLDNGPQLLPNWRYAILATIAGVAYGRVFQLSSSIVSSALLHTLVDWTKHFFF